MSLRIFYNNQEIEIFDQEINYRKNKSIWADEVFPVEITLPFKILLTPKNMAIFGFPTSIYANVRFPQKLSIDVVDHRQQNIPGLLYFVGESENLAEVYVIIGKNEAMQDILESSLNEIDLGKETIHPFSPLNIYILYIPEQLAYSEVKLQINTREYVVGAVLNDVGYAYFIDNLVDLINSDELNTTYEAEAYSDVPNNHAIIIRCKDGISYKDWHNLPQLSIDHDLYLADQNNYYWWAWDRSIFDNWVVKAGVDMNEYALTKLAVDPKNKIAFPLVRNRGAYSDDLVTYPDNYDPLIPGFLTVSDFYNNYDSSSEEYSCFTTNQGALHEKVINTNVMSPQIYLTWAIEEIYKLLGFTVKSNFLNHPDVKPIVIANHKPLGFLYHFIAYNSYAGSSTSGISWTPDYDRYAPANEISFADFMPDMTVKEFLEAVKLWGNLDLDFDYENRTVTIESFNDSLHVAPPKEILLPVSIKKSPNEETIKSMAYAIEANDLLQDNLYDYQKGVTVDEAMEEEIEFEVYLPAERKIKQYTTVDVDIELGQQLILSFFFYRGLQPKGAVGELNYPMSSVLDKNNRGEIIGDLSLSLTAENGIYKRWHEYKAILLNNTMQLNFKNIMRLDMILQLQNGNLFVINGQVISIKDFKYKNINSTEFEVETNNYLL